MMQNGKSSEAKGRLYAFLLFVFSLIFFLYFSSPGKLSGDVLISVTRSILIGFNSLTILLFVLKLSI
ncbi:BnaC02g01660D [Brassica napus]|uniref:Uncharacterized protein n=2 Tax=Brassica TaxID=3705 RepID=A0A0D3AI26_BRAOL|nr:unnamed protein product [Brassica napus]CDY14049.1 BnaC02g01660D [Brassica napus]